MRAKADLTLLVVAVLWGSAFAAQRVAGQFGSVFFFNAARFLLAAFLILPFAFRTKPIPGQWLWMAIAGAVLFAASAVQQIGLMTTGAANAGFLTSLYVVLVPLILTAGWKQRPHAPQAIAVLIAGVGAFFLSASGRLEVHAGDIWELAGAALWAMHVVLLGKFAAPYEAKSFSAGQLIVCGALNLVWAFAFERPSVPPPAPVIGAILYTAIVSLGLGYTLQIWGQKHTPPTDAALILSLESIFAAASGWILLGERLAAPQILGGALILAAVALSQHRPSSKMDGTGHAGNTRAAA